MIKAYKQQTPQIASSAYIAENASVIGSVTLQEGASVWFGTVIRADKDVIHIGKDTNIQDNCTLHTDPGHQLRIAERVTIGHNAILHGTTIEEEVLIGMGAIVLNGSHIGKHSIIGAGALVTENMHIPAGSVAVGCPARVIKQTNAEQIAHIIENAEHYKQLASEYKEEEKQHG